MFIIIQDNIGIIMYQHISLAASYSNSFPMFSDMALIMQGRFISDHNVLHNTRFKFRHLAIKLHALTIRSLVGVVWIVAWHKNAAPKMRKHVQVCITFYTVGFLKGGGTKEEEFPNHSYNFLLYHNLWTHTMV